MLRQAQQPKLKTMNMYIFNETSPTAVYGIGTYIRELTDTLKDSDINICVVHLRSEKSDDVLVESDGIHHLYFPTSINRRSSLDWDRQNELYYRNIVFLLRLQIKNTENLVFHLNHNLCGTLAEELKKTFDCRIVTTVHYLDWCFSLFGNVTRFRKILAMQATDPSDRLKKAIDESYRKDTDLFEKTDHIICLSEKTKHILQYDYKVKPEIITVIYNGLADKKSVSRRSALRKKYGIPDIPIILFVGRIDKIKGLKYALQAFKMVLNTQPCHLIIAGNGAFDLYMKECEDIWLHVAWTGFIGKEKLYDLYSIADIGIMPSFHEQCSYVAIDTYTIYYIYKSANNQHIDRNFN